MSRRLIGSIGIGKKRIKRVAFYSIQVHLTVKN